MNDPEPDHLPGHVLDKIETKAAAAGEGGWGITYGRGTETSRRVSAREWATILTGCLQAVADGTPTRPA